MPCFSNGGVGYLLRQLLAWSVPPRLGRVAQLNAERRLVGRLNITGALGSIAFSSGWLSKWLSVYFKSVVITRAATADRGGVRNCK